MVKEVTDDETLGGATATDDDDDTATLESGGGSSKSRNKKRPMFRGFLGVDGDDPVWTEAVARFPNGVPRFKDKEEGHRWTLDFVLNHGGSNPDYPHLRQSCTTLITWEQIETHLLPNIEKARKEPSNAPKVSKDYGLKPDDTSRNIFERSSTTSVMDGINFRLDLPFHRSLTPASVENTLKYLFEHMKCGIYVMIRNGKLRIFCPFANRDYKNTWKDRLKLKNDMTIEEYYARKRSSGYREENIIDKERWWANGNIICNEFDDDPKKTIDDIQVWGDQFLLPMRDMLAEACRTREIPDCEFFLNKRDYPQLKVNVERGEPVEPYGFIFDRDDRDPEQDVELERCKFKTYAPIMSFYAAKETRFADLPGPSSEDWEGACGEVFPRSFQYKQRGAQDLNAPRDLFTEENFRKFERGWDENRVHTAFFRGTATGGGVTIDTNQRIKCSYLSHIWKNDPVKGGEEPYLDSAIVGWNKRDKKEWDSPMTCLLNPEEELGFRGGRDFFTPIYEQSKYKYLVYIDGHCAACRYGFMMRLGSVILKVAPRQVADTMWYFPLLEPYVDHVPVKADLSDLEDQIAWCRANDDKCRQIAANCLEKYNKYVARDGLLDYIEMMTKSIARRQADVPPWYEGPPSVAYSPPMLNPPLDKCMPKQDRYCARCQNEVEEEERKEKERKAMELSQVQSKEEKKMSHRERMRRKADELKRKRKEKAEAAALKKRKTET